MPELFGFDCYSPKEIAERFENVGVTKAKLPLLALAAVANRTGAGSYSHPHWNGFPACRCERRHAANFAWKSARVLLRRINFSGWARMAALRISRSVFLCLDSLKRLRSASKSIFDKSITGAGFADISTPVIEVFSSLPKPPLNNANFH